MMLRVFALFAAVLLAAPTVLAQQEAVLEPTKDNTLYEHEDGELSNGAGQHIFVGRTNQPALRRALVRFDVEGAVPEEATVTDVELRFHVSMIPRGGAGPTSISVHRLESDWGEGTSDATGAEGMGTDATSNDATWIHNFYDGSLWGTTGGDFHEDASASFEVDDTGEYTVRSEGLITDVQNWMGDPSTNFGWILIGDETTNQSARRLDSRENGTESNRPQLTVTYTTGTSTERPDLPTRLRLAGNYPNPFTASTTIHYDVERAQTVSMTLYDVLGREVQKLVSEYKAAGPHEVSVSSGGLSAGTYVYCFEGGECGRMTLVP